MTTDEPKSGRNIWRSILLLIAATAVGYWLIHTGPKTSPEDEKRPPKMVKTIQVQPGTHQISIQAYGTVIPSRKITIEPEVTGLITQHHPALVPGGLLRKGEELFSIDPTLVKLSLLESEANLASIRATLKEAERKRDETEQLRQQNLISETELAAQEAAVQIQEAELSRLEAGMSRTQEMLRRHKIAAPFNALVIEESIEIGQRVDTGFDAATLVGTDMFWVQASLPVDQLRWVKLPQNNSPGADANVFLETAGTASTRHLGKVARLKGDIQPNGRMARVIISIDNPLANERKSDRTPLLLGSYVRVEIDAGQLTNTYKIDRTALREGDRVWIVDQNSELEIRAVKVRWRKDEHVFIEEGLNPGDAIIVSPLRIALPGTKVKAQDVKAPGKQEVSMIQNTATPVPSTGIY